MGEHAVLLLCVGRRPGPGGEGVKQPARSRCTRSAGGRPPRPPPAACAFAGGRRGRLSRRGARGRSSSGPAPRAGGRARALRLQRLRRGAEGPARRSRPPRVVSKRPQANGPRRLAAKAKGRAREWARSALLLQPCSCWQREKELFILAHLRGRSQNIALPARAGPGAAAPGASSRSAAPAGGGLRKEGGRAGRRPRPPAGSVSAVGLSCCSKKPGAAGAARRA